MTRIDLIKRGDALDALQIVGAWSTKEQRRALSQAYDKLHRVSAVEAVPVVHARWITSSDVPDTLICSACGRRFDMYHFDQKDMPFCLCGAKMDGGADRE